MTDPIIGYIRPSADHPECLALYLPDGRLFSSFAQGQTLADVRELLAALGYAVDADGVVTVPKP
jgi:hypothetical protein